MIFNLPILCRDAAGKSIHPADGFYHVVPKGEFPHPESGDVLVFDEKAHTEILNRFNTDSKRAGFTGLLVDQEHFSYDGDKSSQAYGWIRELQNRDTGTWARIDWTPLGKTAVEDGIYKLISPVFKPEEAEVLTDGHRETIKNSAKKKPGKRVRPLRLDSCGLTNTPNLKGMVPLSNRSGASAPADNQQPTSKPMKKINALLGLSEDATEEAAIAEITKYKNRVETLEPENKTLREAQVESDLAKYANRIKPESKDAIKAQLLANRSATISVLESIPEPATTTTQRQQQQPLHNRATAKTPELKNRGGMLSDEERTKKQNAAVELYKNTHKVSFETAWNACVAADTEGLFNPNETEEAEA